MQKFYLIEGFHLLEEVVRLGAKILQIFVKRTNIHQVAHLEEVISSEFRNFLKTIWMLNTAMLLR